MLVDYEGLEVFLFLLVVVLLQGDEFGVELLFELGVFVWLG